MEHDVHLYYFDTPHGVKLRIVNKTTGETWCERHPNRESAEMSANTYLSWLQNELASM